MMGTGRVSFAELPTEIVTGILSYHLSTLVMAQFVCHHWRDITFSQLLRKKDMKERREPTKISVVVAREGHVNQLIWLRDQGCPILDDGDIALAVARTGDIETLKSLKELGVVWHDMLVGREAARHGHLGVLKWMKQEGIDNFTEHTTISAAEGNQIDILKWLKEEACKSSPRLWYDAFKWGSVELVEWLRDSNYAGPINSSSDNRLMEEAASGGNVKLMQWLFDNHLLSVMTDDGAFYRAAEAGSLPALKWLQEKKVMSRNNFVHAVYTLHHACKRGDVEMARWLCETFDLKSWVQMRSRAVMCVEAAAEVGSLPLLRILKEDLKFPFDATACVSAAEGGHLEALLYLREKECHWNESACAGAAAYGHLDCLKWLIENGCPYNPSLTLTYAQARAQTHVIDWLLTAHPELIDKPGHYDNVRRADEQGIGMLSLQLLSDIFHCDQVVFEVARFVCRKWNEARDLPRPLGARSIMYSHLSLPGLAARDGHLNLLKWLSDRNGNVLTTEVWECAISSGQTDVLSWLQEKKKESDAQPQKPRRQRFRWGYHEETDWDRVGEKAAEVGSIEMLEWLKKEGLLSLSGSLSSYAAKGGRLEVLIWLNENGCPPRAEAFKFAVKKAENMQVLQWLKEQGAHHNSETSDDNASVLKVAGGVGSVSLLQWLLDEGVVQCGSDVGSRVFRKAATKGKFGAVKWLHSHLPEEVTWDEMTWSKALFANNLEMIQWAWEVYKSPPPAILSESVNIMVRLAYGENLEVMKWLHEAHGFKWDSRAYSAATVRGQIPLFEWFLEKGCARAPSPWLTSQEKEEVEKGAFDVPRWTEEVTLAAVQARQVELFKFLVENRCPIDRVAVLDAANRIGSSKEYQQILRAHEDYANGPMWVSWANK